MLRNCKRCAFCSSILCFTLASFSCTVVRRCSSSLSLRFLDCDNHDGKDQK
ncbi:hypothetical protein PF010_g11220 [Phytophthora fragariae]|uniref:Uncharacterized protein n=1 Tax=Phytophthora fragariae TaxID=53985 RepID=A0A6A3FIT2_9STRA|nr:hypothetical protein PF003_g9628 [Phytophthora fragariae]KAE8944281.1 hypothetical protein PF009_g6026 [Phytophthora fragariae]KAE9110285.1 hypothetical protein PF010_g11220 [Phytophthora fragariae]KAE9129687.1 hypothetical protein PF007_g4798 [Phytophthora fragariae]KAE9151458.1 hypothetical protein PF006_g4251 [Phytophthora fragariae]